MIKVYFLLAEIYGKHSPMSRISQINAFRRWVWIKTEKKRRPYDKNRP